MACWRLRVLADRADCIRKQRLSLLNFLFAFDYLVRSKYSKHIRSSLRNVDPSFLSTLPSSVTPRLEQSDSIRFDSTRLDSARLANRQSLIAMRERRRSARFGSFFGVRRGISGMKSGSNEERARRTATRVTRLLCLMT